MALETFKEIVERKGYLVNKEDRKIFEKEIRKEKQKEGNIFHLLSYDL